MPSLRSREAVEVTFKERPEDTTNGILVVHPLLVHDLFGFQQHIFKNVFSPPTAFRIAYLHFNNCVGPNKLQHGDLKTIFCLKPSKFTLTQ